ncbi:3-oxoacyl-ACP synthase III family protein [Streptomyces griseoloalbus]|uniref:3-oxoacyl-[acyl-carrier-protein] synthase-3 n=1 Tax=Streptomyces griseoloalbus TaxID=67303 RepID=A0A7W8FCE9_9ACTN|nr:ketoacyl-ACP synthase III [Streptomyces albaduncus]MBB5129289.1 3-oxoacyl-[acyl-carrier-protein] synthase-3 [Streptomyces albaduncus]GGV81291.1 3-oxoacyl-[acyl-carrier-protein] synthase 3 [Streptomyces griseoloalbus]GGW64976.1 3-oxoacyl-[acyl-carrier-protein] synthase 3 [Streptomyces albaduncus]
MTERPIGILSTGSYLPKEEVTNAEIAARVGVPTEWIEERTRILERRYAAPDEATSDLGIRAAERALEAAGLEADEVDYLIVSTSTPDSPQPPTAFHVQRGLGAHAAVCFDINVVCSGFVYALAIARSLIRERPGGRALVVGADIYSRILDFTDRRTAVLMADGAGAAVVGEVDEPYGFTGFELASRGDAHRLIRVEAGGSRLPASEQTVQNGDHYFRMEGRAVRDFVLDNFPPLLDALCARTGTSRGDIAHFVPHQPNGVMLAQLVERAGLTSAHTHRTLEHYGNAGNAAVAITLDEAHRQGHLHPGDLVLLGGFGGGMSIGAGLIRWGVTA